MRLFDRRCSLAKVTKLWHFLLQFEIADQDLIRGRTTILPASVNGFDVLNMELSKSIAYLRQVVQGHQELAFEAA